jgi:FtsH-binding integral membrane protein
MRITGRRLVLLGIAAVAGGLLIPAKYPAAQGIIDAVVVCVLVCCLVIIWFNMYRRYKIAEKTTLHITALIGACAAAAVLMNAGKVVLLTLLCVIIASGAANMLYAVHLKREGAVG